MRNFEPHPEIALGQSKFNPEIHKAYYLYDYISIMRDIQKGEKQDIPTYRFLMLNDLWFVLYFVIGTPDSVKPNDPFIVSRCKDIQTGPRSHTLDIWARGHMKSSIVTIAETLQYAAGHPEHCSCILSYKASIAKNKFLGSIKQILEKQDSDASPNLFIRCFPDVFWKNPQKEAFRWSIDEGLFLNRNTTRGEASIYAGGLIEGMPTGQHFERRVYDDIVTEDMAKSPGVMEDTKTKFDSSQNLKMMTGDSCHRVVGTFYHFNDPLVFVRDKKVPETDKSKYHLRLHPATHDGQPNGEPVYLSQQELDDLRGRTFNCQQLCNPLPLEEVTLDSSLLKEIAAKDIPRGCYRFVIVDQAGDDDSNLKTGDDWAIMVVDVRPTLSSIGASDVYILNLFSEPLGEAEGIDMITQMYIDAGFVKLLAIEKASMSTTHLHVKAALKKLGRNLTIENDIKKKRSSAIVLMRPQKRDKKKFIDSSVEWPLNNGKIHISSDVPIRYREKLELEMQQHPFGKSDNILNCLAYLFKDIILQYQFPSEIYSHNISPFGDIDEPSFWGG